MSKGHLSPKARQAIRSAKRQKKRTPDARCARCGSAEELTNVCLCYECLAFTQGRSPVEHHHVLGESNDPSTINTPGNTHRALSDRMQDWEDDLLRGDPADPLLWIARLLRSMKEAAQWAVERLDDLVHFLLRLRDWLVQRCGAHWWDASGLGPLWGQP